MAAKYVLDSCALLAFIYKESGYDIVKTTLAQADSGSAEVYMNKVNLFEVYYDIRRSTGSQEADDAYSMIQKLPIVIINGISEKVFREAARIKTGYKISLADSFALGEASVMSAPLITSDHHEFDAVEKNEKISFKWIR